MAQKWVLLQFNFLLNLVVALLHSAHATVPAIFIFGDSTVDVGTNNFIPDTIARANFPHNGIDFPGSIATGRFSNGFNTGDYLANQTGFGSSPPPYLALLNDTTQLNRHILRGVNFASGGSGILDSTGTSLGKVVSLAKQIQQFATVRQNLTNLLGSEATDSLLSKSLYIISIGSNDIFDYFSANNNNPHKQQLMTALKCKYEDQLTKLFSLGVRKFGIISTPPIGCCPSRRVLNSTGGCLDILNEYSQAFYLTTQAMLIKLSSKLEGMKYSLGNTYEMVVTIVDNPLVFNQFKDVSNACCGDGKTPCVPTAKLCPNRQEFLFWDMNHPTQVAAELAAKTLYGGGPHFVTPINFSQLAAED